MPWEEKAMANNVRRVDQENRREIRARRNRQYYRAAYYAADHAMRKAMFEYSFIVLKRTWSATDFQQGRK